MIFNHKDWKYEYWKYEFSKYECGLANELTSCKILWNINLCTLPSSSIGKSNRNILTTTFNRLYVHAMATNFSHIQSHFFSIPVFCLFLLYNMFHFIIVSGLETSFPIRKMQIKPIWVPFCCVPWWCVIVHMWNRAWCEKQNMVHARK